MTAQQRACDGRVPGPGRSVGFYSCGRKTGLVHRDGKWYCNQHDPERVAARRQVRDQRVAAEKAADAAIEARGAALAKRLGVAARTGHTFESVLRGRLRSAEHIQLSFDDAERLLRELQR